MSESKNIHWTEIEELLEQFVLGRLGSAEVAKLEKHLQECDPCRKVVAKERELVAGIRLVGRESVKQRLAQKLEQRKAAGASWYRIAGVAAGIVLLVTVGIYNRWFIGPETQMEKRDRADKTENRLEPAPSMSPERQVSNAEKPSVDAASGALDKEGRKAPNAAAGTPNAAGVESGNIAESQIDRLKDLKATDAAKEGESREKKNRFAVATGASTVATTWVEGTVISEGDQNAPALMEMAAKAKDERVVLRKGKADNLLAGNAANVEGGEIKGQGFIIAQKLMSDLPPSQRAQQQKTSSVQTLLQRNLTSTRITVFLDSLLTKNEFEQAHIQTFGEDSIILNLGSRLVGYKLPPHWTGQGGQQTTKEK